MDAYCKNKNILHMRAFLLSSGYLRGLQLEIPQSTPEVLLDIITKYVLANIKWDHKLCGKMVKFADSYIFIPYKTTNICCADQTLDSKYYSHCSWTVQVHEISDRSWLGWIDVPSPFALRMYDFNGYHLGSEYKIQHSFGIKVNARQIIFSDILQTQFSFPLPSGSNVQSGDKFRMVVDFKKREIELFYNNEFIGIVWKNIPGRLIPAVSNNMNSAGFTISSNNWFL